MSEQQQEKTPVIDVSIVVNPDECTCFRLTFGGHLIGHTMGRCEMSDDIGLWGQTCGSEDCEDCCDSAKAWAKDRGVPIIEEGEEL